MQFNNIFKKLNCYQNFPWVKQKRKELKSVIDKNNKIIDDLGDKIAKYVV